MAKEKYELIALDDWEDVYLLDPTAVSGEHDNSFEDAEIFPT